MYVRAVYWTLANMSSLHVDAFVRNTICFDNNSRNKSQWFQDVKTRVVAFGFVVGKILWKPPSRVSIFWNAKKKTSNEYEITITTRTSRRW